MKKPELFDAGLQLMRTFCAVNKLTIPEVRTLDSDAWLFGGTCAYYRPTYIAICVKKCAAIGVAGPAWSYPGYVVDRTPYGVLQHELGHHADVVKSGVTVGYMGNFSQSMRRETGEAPITSYCPNDGEWFAEMFRLFVTNPDLLRIIRPMTFAALSRVFKPVVQKSWWVVMQDAPPRTIAACAKRIDALI